MGLRSVFATLTATLKELWVLAQCHTFLLNENKEIVYQHTGYKDGDEYDLFKKIEALSK